MKQVKILHCADIHMESNLKNIGRKGNERKAEIKNTFSKIIKICQTSQVQLLLIAGDLFDNLHISEEVLEELRGELEQLKDVVVAIAPGNHDPYTPDSPYARKDFWPDHVIIFKKNMEYVELDSLQVRLFGGGFTKAYETESFLRQIPVKADDYINIGVFHGLVGYPEQKTGYHPITEEEIKNSHLDYLALGHIHERTGIKKIGDTYYAYSGCPEGRGFDELGEKGFYLGTVAKGSVDLKFVTICRRMHLLQEVDVTGSFTAGEMVLAIRKKLQETYGDFYGEHLYKIIIKGTLPDQVFVRTDEIKAGLEELYFVKIKDDTEIEIDFDAAAKEMTLRGIFIRKMLERLENPKNKESEIKKINMALKLGIKAFSREVKYHEN